MDVSPRGARIQNVEFKSVSFKADNSQKKSLRAEKIKRSKVKLHSYLRTEANINKLLTKYFENNQTITRQQYQRLTGQLRATACRTIKKWVEAGKLKNVGPDRSPVYVPGEGYYGN